jgi:hypothetical protein
VAFSSSPPLSDASGRPGRGDGSGQHEDKFGRRRGRQGGQQHDDKERLNEPEEDVTSLNKIFGIPEADQNHGSRGRGAPPVAAIDACSDSSGTSSGRGAHAAMPGEERAEPMQTILPTPVGVAGGRGGA